MNRIASILFVPLVIVSVGAATPDDDGPVPQTPTAFETRNTGQSGEETAVIRREEVKPRKVTYSSVTTTREWRDSKGTVIRARMLAFEAAAGQTQPVVKDGKVRLLVEGKTSFSLVPLAQLSTEDQDFVKSLAAARTKAGAAPASNGNDAPAKTE